MTSKIFPISIFSTLLIIITSSCNKEKKVRSNLVGTYSVQDSITGPPTLDWNHRSYEIEISRTGLFNNTLVISNYANKNNNFNGHEFDTEGEMNNNNFTIYSQNLNETQVRTNSGYFSNDSIYFDIEYENALGEVFYGKCFGKKQ